ncbi:hypothetical protein IJ670_08190 [bacterium]|nr:hypothetical protein [bacterium]
MRINSISNQNFTAMRPRASRYMIEKASKLPVNDRIEVLENIYSLSERASKSSFLDIDVSTIPATSKCSAYFTIIDASFNKHNVLHKIPIGEFVESDINNPTTHYIEGSREPISDYIKHVERVFDETEQEILNKTSKIERLEANIMGLSKSPNNL